MVTVADPARRFRRSRWPDVIMIVGVLALGAVGTYALWGEQWFGGGPDQKDLPVEQAPPSSGGT